MKKLSIISLIVLGLILTGCNYPGSELVPGGDPDDSMATEISKILTGTPIVIEPTPTLQEEDAEPTEPEITEEPQVEPTETLIPEVETPTPTATESPTIAPTPTLSDSDPVLGLGDADWVDNMDDGDNWPTGLNEYTTIDFDDGYLKLTAEKDVDGWRLSWPFLEDFYLEVALQTPECEGSDHFGVMFRVPENANANKGYLFGITCNGQYSVRRWNGDTMAYPVNWTANDAINTGKDVVNKLGVMAKDSNLTFYINGQKVNEISDNTYLEGSFGIFVGGTNVDDLTVWVDQIRYWVNP